MLRPSDDRELEKLLSDHARLIASKIHALEVGKYGIDRDDLMQEIRLRIWRACADGGRHIRNIRAYIGKIVFSVAIREIEKARNERNLVKRREDELSAGGPSIKGSDEKDAIRTALAKGLGRVRSSRREIIVLRLQGFTLEEIAELKRFTPAKTRHLYYRGLAELKKKLNCEGDFR